jgi:DNA-binding transcriptional ArsR family regulator
VIAIQYSILKYVFHTSYLEYEGGLIMENAKQSILSPVEKLALKIYEYNNDIKETIYFNSLVDIMKKNNEMSRSTVSKTLDRLFDLGMVKGEWENHGGWLRALYISGEYEEYIGELYRLTHD